VSRHGVNLDWLNVFGNLFVKARMQQSAVHVVAEVMKDFKTGSELQSYLT
jgi:hypothetical protein